LVQRLALGLDLTVRVRIVGFLFITWVPLLLLVLMEGRPVGASLGPFVEIIRAR